MWRSFAYLLLAAWAGMRVGQRTPPRDWKDRSGDILLATAIASALTLLAMYL